VTEARDDKQNGGIEMNHVEANGVRLAYDELGLASRRLTFLCLPGWAVNRGFFAPLAQRLAARHRVLLLDWRGHGDSERVSGEFGHAELLEDALAVLEAAGVESVIPIGQAHGAWVAVELRRQLGSRVPGIVASSWLVLDPPPPFRGVLDALQDPGRWQQARDQLFSMWTTGAPAEVADRVHREMGAYGFEIWSRGARSIAEAYAHHGNPLRAVAALAPPPPFLHLFSQPKAPEFLAAQESFAREHPWFEFRRLDAVSHFPPLEAPDATATEIERFAAEVVK
jgi:pimeloyl-ACP methyl ester carboxylesterase